LIMRGQLPETIKLRTSDKLHAGIKERLTFES